MKTRRLKLIRKTRPNTFFPNKKYNNIKHQLGKFYILKIKYKKQQAIIKQILLNRLQLRIFTKKNRFRNYFRLFLFKQLIRDSIQQYLFFL